jgi:hypothetical protein
MKLGSKLVLIIAFILLAAPDNAFTSENKSLTLLYQSDFKGYIEGCG